MSIVLRSDPASVPANVTDYQAQNTQTSLLWLREGIYQDQSGVVPKGFVYRHGGATYECTANETITGTSSNYIKFTASGSTATAAYISQATFAADYTWNDEYNGYYETGGALCIPNEFEEVQKGNISTPHMKEGKFALYLRDELNTEKINLALSATVEQEYVNRHKRNISVSNNLHWYTLGTVPENMYNNANFEISIDLTLPSVGWWTGKIHGMCLHPAAPTAQIISSKRSWDVANYQYEPQFRWLYSTTNTSGLILQIGLRSSSTETATYVCYVNNNIAYQTTFLGFLLNTSTSSAVDDTPTYLPDGVTTPTVGSTVWGFSGNVIIWTGTQAISGGYTPTLFTGFDSLMFDKYFFDIGPTGTPYSDEYGVELYAPVNLPTGNGRSTYRSTINSSGNIISAVSARIFPPDNGSFPNEITVNGVYGASSLYLRAITGCGN